MYCRNVTILLRINFNCLLNSIKNDCPQVRIVGWLVGLVLVLVFYSISTIVGHLMLNSVLHYVIWPKKISSNLPHTQNNDSSERPREHSPDVIGAETFFKMEKGASAHRINAWRNVDEICQKIKLIFQPIRDLRGKKQRKPNLIRSKDKNAIKDKFLDSGVRSKEGKRHLQTRTPALRERERGGAILETMHQIFVAASHQTRLDTRSKARRPIKVGIKVRGGRERAETRTLLVCAAHRLT